MLALLHLAYDIWMHIACMPHVRSVLGDLVVAEHNLGGLTHIFKCFICLPLMVVQQGVRGACNRMWHSQCVGIALLFIFRDFYGWNVFIGDFLLNVENPEPQKADGDVGHPSKDRDDRNHDPVDGRAKHHGEDP